MNNIKKILLPVGAIILGAAFIIIGFTRLSQAKNFPEKLAVVTKVDVVTTYDAEDNRTDDYTIYVKYTVDGKEYNEILNGGSSSMKEGDEIKVHYNPEDPAFVTDATPQKATLFIVIGAVAAVIGVGGIVLMFIRKK